MQSLILLLLFGASATLTAVLLWPSGDEEVIRRRAAAIRRQVNSRKERRRVEDEEMAQPFARRVLAPMLERLAAAVRRRAPGRAQTALERRLQQAGNPFSPLHFYGVKLLSVAVAGLAGFLLASPSLPTRPLNAVLLIGALLLLGLRLPEFMLSRMITVRREKIDRALPDVLDLLSVSVEAGLGLDGAVQKVGEKFPEPTSGEFRELLKSIRLGTPRAEALREMAERTGVADMRTFTAAVIQAEQLGVSISRVLKAQAEALRAKRKQRAEEKAMALPVKMLFPLILFIFPTVFIIVLGPVGITIYENLIAR